MRLNAYAAGLGAALIAVVALAAPADAQTVTKKKRYYTTAPQSRVAVAGRPRARITVAPRSFLDAGTEVLPGERKFTDYAFPPNYSPMGVVVNTGGKIGSDNSPLPTWFDLRGPRNPYGW